LRPGEGSTVSRTCAMSLPGVDRNWLQCCRKLLIWRQGPKPRLPAQHPSVILHQRLCSCHRTRRSLPLHVLLCKLLLLMVASGCVCDSCAALGLVRVGSKILGHCGVSTKWPRTALGAGSSSCVQARRQGLGCLQLPEPSCSYLRCPGQRKSVGGPVWRSARCCAGWPGCAALQLQQSAHVPWQTLFLAASARAQMMRRQSPRRQRPARRPAWTSRAAEYRLRPS